MVSRKSDAMVGLHSATVLSLSFYSMKWSWCWWLLHLSSEV